MSLGRAICVSVVLFFGARGAWAFDESVEYFCKNCADEASAMAQAAQYAPPLMCSGGGGQTLDPFVEVDCFSNIRRVILGNHLTNAVFAFDVSRGDDAPWAVSVTAVTLSDVEFAGYREVLKLRREWEKLVKQGIEPVPFVPTIQNEPSPECPSGTALDAYFSNKWQSEIRDQIAATVASELAQFRRSRPWVLRAFDSFRNSLSIGLLYNSVRISMDVPETDSVQTRFPFFFDTSEVENIWGIRDVLVYNVELGDMVDGDPPQAIVSIDLVVEKSKVAGGEQLDRFLAGNTDVTDACVLEKLDQRDVYGGSDLRVGGVPLNADGSVAGGGSGGPSGGARMCIFDFFVNDVYQYSFTAPCDSFEEDKEQIAE